MAVTWRAKAALCLLVVVAGCGRSEGQAGGEVEYTWQPAKTETVAGVPTAAITSAVQQRLGGEPPAGMDAALWKHVRKLYEEYGGAALWMEQNGPNKERTEALLRGLADASTDALRLGEYPIEPLTQALRAVREAKPPSAEQLATADVLLSSAYLALAEDLLSGQTDPKALTTDWHIDYKHERLDSAVVLSLRADRLDRGIAAMRPQDAEYEALRQALVRMRAVVDSGGWQPVPEGKALKRGDSDSPERLLALHARLRAEGIDAGDPPVVPAATPAPAAGDSAHSAPAAAPSSAQYDRTLSNAVATFQERHGIPKDGILGAETVKAMNVSAEYRLGQIAASLERRRWLPRSLGERYIFVNVPAFRLQAYDSGRVALEMKVIVGEEYEGRTTPVFSDMMETVVFRPYWNVTPDIQRKEIGPKIAANPGYMSANNYEYYRDGGETRIRQRPGPKNSLGLVKFLFPNSFNIYLHDTPARSLFQRDVRAFSHGCIRLEKPAELAQWVLGWDADRVEAAMRSGPNNRTVTLPKKIPVYITYFTAYIRDGQLYFGNDLYSRDERLIEALADGARPTEAATRGVEALRALVTE